MGLVKDILRKVDPVMKPFHSYQAPIFPYYHTVSNEDLSHIKGLYNYKNEKDFIRDLDFLLKKYKVLEPRKLLEAIRRKEKIPNNSFLLSFDDGLSEVYKTIVPILNRKGIPAIFFINNKYVDNTTLFYKHKISIIVQYLLSNENDDAINNILNLQNVSKAHLIKKIKTIHYTQEEVIDKMLDTIGVNVQEFLKNQKPYVTFAELNEIKNQGHYLGGHTVSHFPLHQLSLEEQVVEILDSIVWLKTNFSLNYELFSFPFSDIFATKTLLDKLFQQMPNLVLMGNQGMRKDISDQIIQRFSLEKEAQADIGVRMNIIYRKYLSLIGKQKITRKSL
ncbi:NodB homology domain-containing protein [Tenacibaculum sp. 190130A14a]|uniref:NodB homology domain-containing protein n=1 Tax=Tenacibaculum polynesiense TaxID=3137857 RepID=A0ABM9P7X9_9FLAO